VVVDSSVKNYAESNAKLYGILPQSVNETGAQFRERVARELEKQGKNVEAHETLHNGKESGNIFAYGSLDDGYGDEFITQMAEIGESSYQSQLHPRNDHGCYQLALIIVLLILLIAVIMISSRL